ncbi:unnamed protein product, partial [Mesorhabditis spiculigera]
MNVRQFEVVDDDYGFKELGVDPESLKLPTNGEAHADFVRTMVLPFLAAMHEEEEGVTAAEFLGTASALCKTSISEDVIRALFPECHSLVHYLDTYFGAHIMKIGDRFRLKSLPNDENGLFADLEEMSRFHAHKIKDGVARKRKENRQPQSLRRYFQNYNVLYDILQQINTSQSKPPTSRVIYSDLAKAYLSIDVVLNAKYLSDRFGRSSFKKIFQDSSVAFFASRFEYTEGPKDGIFYIAIKPGVQKMTPEEIDEEVKKAEGSFMGPPTIAQNPKPPAPVVKLDESALAVARGTLTQPFKPPQRIPYTEPPAAPKTHQRPETSAPVGRSPARAQLPVEPSISDSMEEDGCYTEDEAPGAKDKLPKREKKEHREQEKKNLHEEKSHRSPAKSPHRNFPTSYWDDKIPDRGEPRQKQQEPVADAWADDQPAVPAAAAHSTLHMHRQHPGATQEHLPMAPQYDQQPFGGQVAGYHPIAANQGQPGLPPAPDRWRGPPPTLPQAQAIPRPQIPVQANIPPSRPITPTMGLQYPPQIPPSWDGQFGAPHGIAGSPSQPASQPVPASQHVVLPHRDHFIAKIYEAVFEAGNAGQYLALRDLLHHLTTTLPRGCCGVHPSELGAADWPSVFALVRHQDGHPAIRLFQQGDEYLLQYIMPVSGR